MCQSAFIVSLFVLRSHYSSELSHITVSQAIAEHFLYLPEPALLNSCSGRMAAEPQVGRAEALA